MQALEWAVLYGDDVDAIVPIASTHALRPQGVAWNAIARNSITADPDWQGGHYYGTGRAPARGMGVARMVGHMTYLSAQALGQQVRPAAPALGRHPLRARGARVRDRELPAPSGRQLRQTLRREHVSIHVARAVVFRSRAAIRRGQARGRAAQRARTHAADHVQLRLALPAGRLRGARGRASSRRQGSASCT